MVPEGLGGILGAREGKLVLELTYKCNSFCACCSTDSYAGNQPLMDTRIARRAIDQAVDQGITYLLFSGGEPTLHDRLPGLVAYGKLKGMRIRMNTNGWKNYGDYWRMLKDRGLDYGCVSIDPSHNHRELNANPVPLGKAMGTVEEMVECGIESVAIMTPFSSMVSMPKMQKAEKEMLRTLRAYYQRMHERFGGMLDSGEKIAEFEVNGKKHYLVVTDLTINYDSRSKRIIHRRLGKCPSDIDPHGNFFVRITPKGNVRTPCNSDQHMKIRAQGLEEGIMRGIRDLEKNSGFMRFLESGTKSKRDVCDYCIETFLNKRRED